MFGELLGGLIDKEKATFDTIQATLETVAEELGCSYNEFFVMIKPIKEDFSMKFYIYKTENGSPKLVREMTIKEVVGD